MSLCLRNFAIPQDEIDMAIAATKDACDILIQMDTRPDMTRTMIEILNKESHQDICDLE